MSDAKRETTACPVCGVIRMEPRPHVPSTPWDVRCGCDDRKTCWGHVYGVKGWDPPARPDDATMLERAKARCVDETERWNEYREKFRRASAALVAVEGIPTEDLEAGALAKALDALESLSMDQDMACPRCGRCLGLHDDDCDLAAALRALGRLP